MFVGIQVTGIGIDQQGGFIITFTAAASGAANTPDSQAAAAGPGDSMHADAVVLATGGFGANREMLKVCSII
jgi:hypothetical protein